MMSRAQGVMNLMHRDLLGAISNVMFAEFARVRRDQGDLIASYQKAVANVACVAWPFYGFAALFPHEILRVLFGPQWDEAAELVPLFCLAARAARCGPRAAAHHGAGPGRSRSRDRRCSFSAIRIAVLATTAAYFRDLVTFAAVFAGVYFLHIPILNHYLAAAVGTRRWLSLQLGSTIVVALASLAIPGGVAGLAARGVVERPGAVMLAMLGGSIVVTWLLAVHWTKHPISRDALFIDGLRKVHLALEYRRAEGLMRTHLVRSGRPASTTVDGGIRLPSSKAAANGLRAAPLPGCSPARRRGRV
jgi:hypothetical protein